jgi:hypothetical protein
MSAIHTGDLRAEGLNLTGNNTFKLSDIWIHRSLRPEQEITILKHQMEAFYTLQKEVE